MRGFLQHIALLCCGMLLISGCHDDDWAPQETQQGNASLQIVVRSAANATRGIQELADDGIMSEEERYVDGQAMYRLCVCLKDGDNVVATTILEPTDTRFSDDNTEAVIVFDNLDYSRTYQLYAVANYGDHGTLQGALRNFDVTAVATDYTVSASSDNLCNKSTPYPISLMQEIKLNPGANSISAQLLRTFSRVRINVRNQSAHANLFVTDFRFANQFAQSSANLFTEGGTATVSPVVNSNGAVTPFEAGISIPKIDAQGNVSEKTIFDCYMLESAGGNYKFSLHLNCGDGAVKEVFKVSTTALTNHNNIEDGGMYVLYNTDSKRYIYTDGTKMLAGVSYLVNGELNNNYVWRFNRTSGSNYMLESLGSTGYYARSSAVTNSQVPMTVTPTSSDYFMASTSGTSIRFQSTSTRGYYLQVQNYAVSGATSSNRRNFQLFQVLTETEGSGVAHNAEVPIRVIDKNTGVANQIERIRRNDFLEILVNVTYNEKTGNIQFEVANWDEVNGDVTFD